MSSKIRQFKRQETKPEGITATLGELLGSTDSLTALLGKQIPISTAFRLTKLVRARDVEMEQYDAAKKLLMERYFESKDGEFVKVKEGERETLKFQKGKTQPELDKEHGELLATEVTISGKKIKISELGSVTIEPAYLFALSWLLDD